jgi:iron(III) transport system permease protein
MALPALLFAALTAVPVAVVVASILMPGTGEVWRHLAQTVLADYVLNTIALMLGVGIGVIAVGVGAAWLVTLYDFPGRRAFEWALVLPMAMPAYVMAYAYTDFLQFTGPVQSALRETFGWTRHDYWFPDIRSVPGAIAMFVFVLYPYVYLLARAAFLERSANVLEVGRTLGYGSWSVFLRLSVPLARPAIAGGTALALMETLADYGTVAYFSVHTFTTGIYRAWLSLGDRVAASQLAAALLGFVLLVLLIERLSRGRASYAPGARSRPMVRHRLRGAAAVAALLGCAIPVALGFVLPAAILAGLAAGHPEAHVGARYLALAGNSFTLAALTAALAALAATLLAYAARLHPGALTRAACRLVGLGYAVPGAVIAVGVLIPLAAFDNWLDALARRHLGWATGLLFTGTIVALVYAYLVRFLSVALESVEAGLGKVTRSMDDAARSLGYGPAATLWRVHLPLIAPSVLTAALLVFVDVMKELPATLVIRPFNFDTLATQAYTFASDERLAQAAVASLVIVAVGVLPVIIVLRTMTRGAGARPVTAVVPPATLPGPAR